MIVKIPIFVRVCSFMFFHPFFVGEFSMFFQDSGRPPTCVACAIITATNGAAGTARKNVAGNPVTLQCECGSERSGIGSQGFSENLQMIVEAKVFLGDVS